MYMSNLPWILFSIRAGVFVPLDTDSFLLSIEYRFFHDPICCLCTLEFWFRFGDEASSVALASRKDAATAALHAGLMQRRCGEMSPTPWTTATMAGRGDKPDAMNDGHSGNAGFSEERDSGCAARWTEAVVARGDERTMQWRRGRRASERRWRTGGVVRRASGGAGRWACEEFSLFFFKKTTAIQLGLRPAGTTEWADCWACMNGLDEKNI
jgi:hypothetical protein